MSIVTSAADLPLFLTVEEAGNVLRIGRTKAYAMAREWRVTGGRSGLPVIDLGNVLRVPRRALEELFGIELTELPSTDGPQAVTNITTGTQPSANSRPPQPARPRSRAPRSGTDQLGLFSTQRPTS